ncbi:hypothetical protein CCUG20998_03311 [Mycobacterium marinum]|nr:hypothetical protein CCUG20998_03311 [Mycobacterium marinum]RFZ30117.1 hypothetical protein DSM44344_00555 [Mycobacterium marinum]
MPNEGARCGRLLGAERGAPMPPRGMPSRLSNRLAAWRRFLALASSSCSGSLRICVCQCPCVKHLGSAVLDFHRGPSTDSLRRPAMTCSNVPYKMVCAEASGGVAELPRCRIARATVSAMGRNSDMAALCGVSVPPDQCRATVCDRKDAIVSDTAPWLGRSTGIPARATDNCPGGSYAPPGQGLVGLIRVGATGPPPGFPGS